MRIVGDAQLIGHGQEQGIGLRDSFILLQLLNEDVRVGGIASTEDRSRLLVDVADLVGFLAPAPEVGAIAIVDEREDAATDRDARIPRVASLLPGCAEHPDLGGLLDVEGSPVSSSLSVELCRFIPSFAAQAAVALEPD